MLGKLEVFFEINNKKSEGKYLLIRKVWKCSNVTWMMIWEISKAGHLAESQPQIEFSKNPLFMCGSNSIPLYALWSFSPFSSSKHQKNSAEMKWKYVFAKSAKPLQNMLGRTELNVFSWFLKVKPFWIVFLSVWSYCVKSYKHKKIPNSTMMLLYCWTS